MSTPLEPRKVLIRLCLEILSGIRTDLNIDDANELGVDITTPLYRKVGDLDWFGTDANRDFTRPVRVTTQSISSAAIDTLMRIIDEKEPKRKGRK